MVKEILIGTNSHGKTVYLQKHHWDCDWYWACGYLENNNLHFHFSSMVPNKSDKHKIVFDAGFSEPETVKLVPGLDGWILMELFKQVYILKDYYELVYIGHANITEKANGVEKNLERATEIKNEMEKILNVIWEYVTNNTKNK